jgi:hypothetical protein
MATFFKNSNGDRVELDTGLMRINSSLGRTDVSLTDFVLPSVQNFTIAGNNQVILLAYEGVGALEGSSVDGGVFARVYDWAGNLLSGDLHLSDQTLGASLPSIQSVDGSGFLQDGGFLATWETEQVGTLPTLTDSRYAVGRLFEYANTGNLNVWDTFVIAGNQPIGTKAHAIGVSSQGDVSVVVDLNGDGLVAEEVVVNALISETFGTGAPGTIVSPPSDGSNPVDPGSLPLLHFISSSSTYLEGDMGDKAISIEVGASQAFDRDIVVPLTYSGSASLGEDYFDAPSEIRISAGQTSATVTIRLQGDLVAEGDETLVISGGAPTNGLWSTGDDSMTLTIKDGTFVASDHQVIIRPDWADPGASSAGFAYVVPTNVEGLSQVMKVLPLTADALGDGSVWSDLVVQDGAPAGGFWVETSPEYRGKVAQQGMLYSATDDIFYSPSDASLLLGSIPGTDYSLKLINPVQASEEVTYYIADLNANGSIWSFAGSPTDILAHDDVDQWLGDGSDTSVEINSRSEVISANGHLYQVVLPTRAEWTALIESTNGTPSGWQTHHYALADQSLEADYHEMGDTRMTYLYESPNRSYQDSVYGTFLALGVRDVSLSVSVAQDVVVEGTKAVFEIHSAGFASGTAVDFFLSGLADEDLVSVSSLSGGGQIVLNDSGVTRLEFEVARDGINEGIESLILTLGGQSPESLGNWSVSQSIAVQDRAEIFSGDFAIADVITVDSSLASAGYQLDQSLSGFRAESLGDNRLAVVWQARNTGAEVPSEDLAYAVLDLTSKEYVTSGVIEQPYGQGQVSLVKTEDQVFVSFYSQPAGWHADEWGFFLGADGTVTAPKMLMDGWAGADWEPNIGRFASGEFILTFDSERSGAFSVYGQKLDATGTPVGEEFLISGNGAGREMTLIEDLLAVVPETATGVNEQQLFMSAWVNRDIAPGIQLALMNADTGEQLDLVDIDQAITSRPKSLVLNEYGQGGLIYIRDGEAYIRAVKFVDNQIDIGSEVSLRPVGVTGDFVDASSIATPSVIGMNLVSYDNGVQTVSYVQAALTELNKFYGNADIDPILTTQSVVVDQSEIPDVNQTFFVDSDISLNSSSNTVLLSYKTTSGIEVKELEWMGAPIAPVTQYTPSPSGGGYLLLASDTLPDSDYGPSYGEVPYVYVPDSESLSVSGEMTVSTWVFKTPTVDDWMNVYDKPEAHLLEFSPEGGFDFRAENEAMDFNVNGPALDSGSWAHLALVSKDLGDGNFDFEVYVDGSLVSSEMAWQTGDLSNTSGVRDSDYGWYIGLLASQDPYNLDPWQGAIDDFQVWSRALTQEEISQQYLGDFSYEGQENLVLRYEFDDGLLSNGSAVSDSSGQGNNGVFMVSAPGEVYLSPYNASKDPSIDLTLVGLDENQVDLALWIDPNQSLESLLFKLTPEEGYSVDINQQLVWAVSEWAGDIGGDGDSGYRFGAYSLDALADTSNLQQLFKFSIDRGNLNDLVLSLNLDDLILNDDFSSLSNTNHFDFQLASTVSVSFVDELGNGPSVSESGTGEAPNTLRFQITLDAPLLRTESLHWVLEDELGLSAEDDFIGPLTGEVVFEAGQTQASIEISIKDDSLVESVEQFRLRLTDASIGIVLDETSQSEFVSIVDDDKSVASIQAIETSLIEGDEGVITVHRFEVTLDQAAAETQLINWTTQGIGDRPASGSDFNFADEMPSGSVQFEAGERTKVIEVAVKGDSLSERTEMFQVDLALSDVSGSRIQISADHGTAEGIIIDDDGAPVEGIVYHWKSHALLEDVEVSVSGLAHSNQSGQLFELRDVQFTAEGDLQAKVWINLEAMSVENFDLEIGFDDLPDVQFDANQGLDGWAIVTGVDSSSQSGQSIVSIAGLSLSPDDALNGSAEIGSITLDLSGDGGSQKVNFLSGFAGDPDTIVFEALVPYATQFDQNVSFSSISGADGSYSVGPMPLANYDVEVTRTLTANETGYVITSSDALAALKMAVGLNPNANGEAISPYQFISADINNSGTVTALDALGILKMAVRRSDAPDREWLFVDESIDFLDEVNQEFTVTRVSVPTKEQLKLVADTFDDEPLNLVAILKGDVNGSWSAPSDSTILSNEYFYVLASENPERLTTEQFFVPLL